MADWKPSPIDVLHEIEKMQVRFVILIIILKNGIIEESELFCTAIIKLEITL